MTLKKLVALPLATLVAATIGLMIWQGTPWVLGRVVHENGRLTLLQTILYYAHAAGELPLDLILGTAIGAALARWRAPGDNGAFVFRRRALVSGFVLGATVAVIVIGTTVQHGIGGLIDAAGQWQTREGVPLVWGSHWRAHLLERAAELLIVIAIAAAARSDAADATGPTRRRVAGRWLAGTLLAFATLSAIFGVTSEPFVDAHVLGHQLRELVTHLLVTVPLAMAVVGQWTAPTQTTESLPRRVWPLAVGLAGLAIGTYVLAAAVATGARHAGQQQSLAALLLPHFFEHAFTYIVVTAAAATTFASVVGRYSPRSAVTGSTRVARSAGT